MSKSKPVMVKVISCTPACKADRTWTCAFVPHRAGENLPGVHAGQVQRPGELALQGRAAVRDGVALEEPRLGLHLVTGLADF